MLSDRDDHRLPIDSLTLATWMEHWVESARIRESVRDTYRSTIKAHITSTWLGAIRLPDLEVEDLEKYAHECEIGEASTRKIRRPVDPPRLNRKHNPVMETVTVPRPLAPNTIRGIFTVISSALKTAQARGHIGWNPVRLMQLPTASAVEPESLSEVDARLVLAEAATHPAEEARWLLGVLFGLRPAEVLGLTVDQVHREHISVRQQLQEFDDGKIRLVPMLKTAAGRRDIPIPATVSEALQRAITWKRQTRISNQARWTDWQQDDEDVDLVFVQANGRPVTQRVDTARWQALLNAVGLPHHRRYVARHTAASLMISMGMPIQVVSNILGHKRTSFTLDRYVHALDAEKREAAEKLGQFLA